MKNKSMFLMVLSVVCASQLWAGDLESLYQKLPEKTLCFAATGGTDNFKEDFNGSIMGQIAADSQVKAFFKQLMDSLSKAEDFKALTGPGADYEAFVIELLKQPTLIAVVPLDDDGSDEACAMLLREPIVPGSAFDKVFQQNLKQALGKQVVEKQIEGVQAYVPADPNMAEKYYIVSDRDFFMIAFDDSQHGMLKHLKAAPYSSAITDKVRALPATSDVCVLYADLQKMMTMIRQGTATDPDAQQAFMIIENLGLADIQYYCIKAGFEGKNLIIDGSLKTPTNGAIFDVVNPVDKALLEYADPKAIQASAVYFDVALLYDLIVDNVALCDADIKTQIADFETTIGCKLRDELLASLEGTFMGYMLPAYSSPELLSGGYVVTARLNNVDQFKKCMASLEAFVKSKAPADQLQITSQKTENEKEIHIWAIGLAAMMQVIPAWAVEDDMLVIASHPTIVKKMIQRVEAGTGDSLITRPEFANAMNRIPGDAFSMNLTDSKSQARQFMKMLQQYWPMLNMGLTQKGIQLPIMLPSIEPYIEQMEPGLCYVRKAPDGIEFHYEGTGLEATSGGIAGGAMGMAILMPALSRTKKVAERVVCGTNLKGLSTALFVYVNDYDDILPGENWCDVLILEADVSPKSFVCPQSDAIEGESSYAMNKNVCGKNMGKLSSDVVLLFETDKGVEQGPRNTSIKTRKHYEFLKDSYDGNTMVYKNCFNQVGGPEDLVLRHNSNGKQGCNIAFADGHIEFVTQDRIAGLRWTAE